MGLERVLRVSLICGEATVSLRAEPAIWSSTAGGRQGSGWVRAVPRGPVWHVCSIRGQSDRLWVRGCPGAAAGEVLQRPFPRRCPDASSDCPQTGDLRSTCLEVIATVFTNLSGVAIAQIKHTLHTALQVMAYLVVHSAILVNVVCTARSGAPRSVLSLLR